MSLLVISAGRAATALPAMHHAEGGIRTPMGLRPLRPERSASTSSTTSAYFIGGPNIGGVFWRVKSFLDRSEALAYLGVSKS